jgi:ketosteroid isomerase-like protein
MAPRRDDGAVSGPLPVPLGDERARQLAVEWIAAWNSHDLDAIMALYAPGVVFQTPTIIDTLGIADGIVSGAERLREHFARGLQRLPDLRFELDAVYAGVTALAMTYRWGAPTPQAWVGTPVCELHEYDTDGLIARVQALYAGLSW